MKYDINWLLKSSCFNIFANGKHGLFLTQKFDWKMIFTDYWKGLVLNFSVVWNTVFFESRSWWKDDIYWLLRISCFKLFRDGKYGLFSAKRLMERWYLDSLFELSMIFQDLGNIVFRAACVLMPNVLKSFFHKNLISINWNCYFQDMIWCGAFHINLVSLLFKQIFQRLDSKTKAFAILKIMQTELRSYSF